MFKQKWIQAGALKPNIIDNIEEVIVALSWVLLNVFFSIEMDKITLQ